MGAVEEHIKIKRLSIYSRVRDLKKIYLDTNYWIKLRDAEANNNPTDKLLLKKLKELVQQNKCIVPISEANFYEILKQSDLNTLKKSALLIDELSLGISVITEEDRRRLEFMIFVLKSGKKEVHQTEELVWTKLSLNVLYSILPRLEREDLRIIFIDFLETISFADLILILEQQGSHKPYKYKDNVDFLNEAKERYKNENKTFEQMFLSELSGYIDLFKESLNESMELLYSLNYGKRPTEAELANRDSNALKNFVYNAFRLKKATIELPSYSILPELHASIRWNRTRKYIDGDTIDFMHASAALPYFDFFFTERELKTIIHQRRLNERYSCVVESNTEKVLELLNSF